MGAFYLNIDTESDNGLKGPDGSFAAVFGGIEMNIGTRAELETDSYSVFGQYEYDLTDKLTFIGGARLMREERLQPVDGGGSIRRSAICKHVPLL